MAADDQLTVLWPRIRAGGHTAVVGLSRWCGAPDDIVTLRIPCDLHRTSGGPVLEAARRIAAASGSDAQDDKQLEAGALRGAMRAYLLGEVPLATSFGADLVAAMNRLAGRSSTPMVMVFERLDAADERTLAWLLSLLSAPSQLRMPLLLTSRERQPTGTLGELIEVMRSGLGEDAVIDAGGASTTAADPFEWRQLDPGALAILRAVAALGPCCEVALVAEVMARSVLDVWSAVQIAHELGAPIEDDGDGRVRLVDEDAADLSASLLPSVRALYRSRAASALASAPGRGADSEGSPDRVPSGSDFASRRHHAAGDHPYVAAISTDAKTTDPTDGAAAGVAAIHDCVVDGAAVEKVAAAHGGRPAPPRAARHRKADQGSTQPTAKAAAWAPGPPASAEQRHGTAQDGGRAARYLAMAGEELHAAAGYLDEASRSADAGHYARAVGMTEAALEALSDVPAVGRAADLRFRAAMDLAGYLWLGAGAAEDFSLRRAHDAALRAQEALPEHASATERADLMLLKAGIAYDLGDLRSLEGALADLNEASRSLLESGEPQRAAGLFNDQAALYLRLGDPLRATHLLSKSREVFEVQVERAPERRDLRRELAETDHLLAKLPLHAPLRPGREADAMMVALDHALAAARAFESLGDMRSLSRVQETMGRIETARGRLKQAVEHLSRAVRAEERLGDATGLARATAALSDVLIAASQPAEALSLLAQSVALNVEKGSPIGLAFNRRTLDTIRARGAEQLGQDQRFARALMRVDRDLTDACGSLGSMPTPPGV